MHIKNFDKWNVLKKHINTFEHLPKIKERDIWWCSLGVNIGNEMDGKNDLFHRPILILKKLSSDICLIAPITSKVKEGTWYTQIVYHNETRTVCLHQITIINTKRLGKYVVRLNTDNFKKVTNSFYELYSLANNVLK